MQASLQAGAHFLMSESGGEHDLSPSTRTAFIIISISLVIIAGLMSGLTLGLMSMDVVELEVLKRSGTAKEQCYAAAIMPIISNQHFLLVTLLLCNAVAMEALPLFLDRLADPVTAIVISVTAVLVFGEIFPQAVCSR
jgi:metal transporter CNNM